MPSPMLDMVVVCRSVMVRSGMMGRPVERPGEDGGGRGESGTNVLLLSSVVMVVRVLWSAGFVTPSWLLFVPTCNNQ